MKTATKHMILLASIFVLFAVLGVLSQAGEVSASGWDAIKPIQCKYSTSLSRTHTSFYGLDPYFKKLEDVSGGKLKVKEYVGGVLFQEKGALEGLKGGGCDALHLTITYHPSALPYITLITDCRLNFSNSAAASGATSELLTLNGDLFEEDFKRNNMLALGTYATGPYWLIANKPVSTLADVRGLKVRTSGIHNDYVKALGGIPVGVTLEESFEALMRRTIDGSLGSVDYLRSYSYWDVCKYVSKIDAGVYNGGAEFALNKDWFDSLPKIAKRAIIEYYPIVASGITVSGYTNQERNTAKMAVEKHGVKFLEPTSDLKAAINDYIRKQTDEVIDKAVKDKGINREKTEKIVKTYLTLYKKWIKLVEDEAVQNDPKLFEQVLRNEIYDPWLVKLGLK